MRIRILIALLVALGIPRPVLSQLNCSGGCTGNITISALVAQNFQSATGARSNGVGSTVRFKNAVVSGDIILAGCDWSGGAATNASIVDTVGTVYTRIEQQTGNANNNAAIFTGTAAGSGTNTITPTYPAGSTFTGCYATEIPPTLVTSTVDVHGSVSGAIGTSTSLVLTTTTPGDFIWCEFGGDANGSLWFPAAGLLLAAQSNANDSGGAFFGVQGTAGALDLTPFDLTTIAPSTFQVVACMALKHP